MLHERNLFNLLSAKDKRYISQLMIDAETGGHVLRTPKCWKQLGIDTEDYYKWRNDEWYKAITKFGLTNDNSSMKEKQMWLYAKVCSDYDFAKLLGLTDDKKDNTEEITPNTELIEILQTAIQQTKQLEKTLSEYKDI